MHINRLSTEFFLDDKCMEDVDVDSKGNVEFRLHEGDLAISRHCSGEHDYMVISRYTIYVPKQKKYWKLNTGKMTHHQYTSSCLQSTDPQLIRQTIKPFFKALSWKTSHDFLYDGNYEYDMIPKPNVLNVMHPYPSHISLEVKCISGKFIFI